MATLMASYQAKLDVSDLTPVQREALDWVGRLHSGYATKDDLVAWDKWQGQSAAHAEASMLAQKIVHFTLSHERQADEALTPVPLYQRPTTRRLAFAGLAVTAGGYGLFRPPMGLWPSLSELSSDYRTRVGEQRKVTLAQGLSVQLDTATSIRLRNRPGHPGVNLIAGEIAIDVDLPGALRCSAVTDAGEVIAQKASFDLRKTATGVRTTCVTGTVTVRQQRGQVLLGAGEALSFTRTGNEPGKPYRVDTDVATAWRRGQIIFRDAPLHEIVGEINRYRRGEIILLNAEAGNRRLSGSFSVQHLDDMADHLAVFANVTASTLPGGIILLS